MKENSQEWEPIAHWVVRSKLAARGILELANEMEVKGLPEEMFVGIRKLAEELSDAIDRVNYAKATSELVRGYAAALDDLADEMEAAADEETV